jgi:hypothetical protein
MLDKKGGKPPFLGHKETRGDLAPEELIKN